VTEVLASTTAVEARFSMGAICLVANEFFGLAAQNLAIFERLAGKLGLRASDWSYYSPRDE